MAGIIEITKEVLLNAYYAKLALQEFEGIADKAKDIQKSEKFFFGFNQKVMLDFTVLQICKIYDQSNKEYKKHTVFEIYEFLKDNTELGDYNNIYSKTLNKPLNHANAKEIFNSELSNIKKFKKQVGDIIQELSKSNDFKKLKTYRNKKVAHSEQLKTELPKDLPSLERLRDFINIAIDISELVGHIFGSSLGLQSQSMRIATHNLVEKINNNIENA